MIIVHITCQDESEAKKIARHLLDLRIIACANFFPIQSMYWWQDNITEEKEFALICKSTRENFDEIKKEVEALHSYDTPLIEFWNVDGVNQAYFEWLSGELKK